MKIIYYSKDAQFQLINDEYEKALTAWNNGQKAFITRLNVSLSPLYIWAGEKTTARAQNRDNQWCVDRYNNNDWRLEKDESVKVDLSYYPELRKHYEAQNSLIGESIKK